MTNKNAILPIINSFEEYENLKLKSDIFEKAAQAIITKNHLRNESLSLFDGTNIVFAYGSNHIIKIFPPFHQNQFTSDFLMMNHLKVSSIKELENLVWGFNSI